MTWQRLFENPSGGTEHLIIKSDHRWKEFKHREEVPKRVLAGQFDYQDPEDSSSGFMKWRSFWYHLDQFSRLPEGSPEAKLGWQGYLSESMSTGMLVKVSRDGDEYQIATYRSRPK